MARNSESTGKFEAKDGLEIFYRRYRGETTRALLVIAHGLGEHSGRYGNVIRTVLPMSISVYALDHRGHGRSGGKRGHVSSFDQYLHDLETLFRIAKGEMPSLPMFLLGHSLGGLISLGFALSFPEWIDGLIVSSPALGTREDPPPMKALLGRILSVAWPSLDLGNGLDVSKISHDKEVVEQYLNDPMVHNRVTSRWFTEFMKTMETVNRRASELDNPILLQIAGDDRLVDAESSRAFFERLTMTDKTLYVYEELYHEIYNEEEEPRSKVLKELEMWLKIRV